MNSLEGTSKNREPNLLSHNDLVKIAEKWLLKTLKCSFAITELATYETAEIPDAIGFRSGYSILIECKTNRADFLADAKKIFRRNPSLGVGTYRFYLCPEGVIEHDDLPEKWGLIWVNEKGKPRQIVGPEGNIWSAGAHDFYQEKNIQAEWGIMASALRRLHLCGVLPIIYNNQNQAIG